MTRLILIGSRGAGKTSVGRVLAARLARSFIDLDDQAIALVGGGRVRDFLARSGEPAWRALEHRALLAAFESSGPATIVALGGGAVTVPAIRELVESARRLRTARPEAVCRRLHDRRPMRKRHITTHHIQATANFSESTGEPK